MYEARIYAGAKTLTLKAGNLGLIPAPSVPTPSEVILKHKPGENSEDEFRVWTNPIPISFMLGLGQL